MDSRPASKRLRLRRPDRRMICDCDLPAGREAVWDRDIRKVSCQACSSGEGLTAGEAGAFLARVVDEPSGTRSGSREESGRLVLRLDSRSTWLEPAFASSTIAGIPGHGNANVDHLAIGPGGVTVIDSKTHRGKLRVDTRR